MANPKKIVQPSDLPVRKSHSQVVAVTGGTLVFIAGMTSRSERTLRRFIQVTCAPNCARCAKTHFVVRFPVSFLVAALPR
jgi:hypothetical protein